MNRSGHDRICLIRQEDISLYLMDGAQNGYHRGSDRP
jgi:hypothetical protein